MTDLPFRRLDPEMPLPERAHPGDAGFDLRSAVDIEVEPGERAMVPTGIAVAIPWVEPNCRKPPKRKRDDELIGGNRCGYRGVVVGNRNASLTMLDRVHHAAVGMRGPSSDATALGRRSFPPWML